LDNINHHIIEEAKKSNTHAMTSHEILLKKKVNLHKYLKVICCRDILSKETIEYINKNYPNVIILDNFPLSAQNLNIKN